MTVGIVLDISGGTKEKYDALNDRMEVGDKRPPGCRVHTAGPQAGGWRVVDVWDSLEAYERFRDERILPHARALGIAPPQMRVLEVDDEMPNDGRAPTFLQLVLLPGLDRAAFRALHEEVVPGDVRPEGLTFHVNGPYEDGWCVIDGWTSKELRDAFMGRTGAILQEAPLSGPPTIQELPVEASLVGEVTARV
jgi:hypothetical protein